MNATELARQERTEMTAHYRAVAEAYRKNKKYTQDKAIKIYKNMVTYINNCKLDDKPITIAGLTLAGGLGRNTFNKMKNGDMDSELFEYMDLYHLDFDTEEEYDGMPCTKYRNKIILLVPYSEIIERVSLMHEEETELRLYEKGRVGDIFTLKAQHDWQDEHEKTVTNIFAIASPDDAQKAIEMLK